MLNRAALRIARPKTKWKLRAWPGLDLARDHPMPGRGCSLYDRKTYPPGSRKVEAIKVHHFVPGRHKVTHEGLLRVAAGIDFRDGPELGV